MKRSLLLPTAALVLTLSAFSNAAEPNTITPEEKAAGWQLLFDGNSIDGWVGLGTTSFPAAGWSVKEGSLHHEKGGGDIVTAKNYLNFELIWDWKISEVGNSGVKYNLPNPAKGVGFEYQMLDDARHADASRGLSHQTAALYDLIDPAADRKTKPAGEWNTSRLLVKGAHVEQWLNGSLALTFEIGSPEMQERIAKSKYAKVKDFGVKIASPILLQDHGDVVDFRSMKLRELGEK